MHRSLALCAVILVLAAPLARAQSARGGLERTADEIGKAVEEIRGLHFRSPVKKGVETRAELRKFISAEVEKDTPDEKIEAQRKAYVKLGFLPRGLDLKKTIVDLYAEQIAGFYNPEKKELFLLEDGGEEQNVVMAHELTHALQDQTFDMLPMQKSVTDNDDRSLALTSLIEGDATVVMFAYMLRAQGLPLDVKDMPDLGSIMKFTSQLGQLLGPGQDALKRAPKILVDDLMFGYEGGAGFCHRLIKRRGGFSAVSGAFRDPPQSSEQVMHPEKYLGAERDDPIEVSVPDLAARLPGWKLLERNVMGEFNTALLLKEKLPKATADRAAAGWGGDQWQVLEGPKGQLLLAWYSVWDTPGDADEFAAAYRDFAAKRGDGATLDLAVHGDTVTIIDGDEADAFERVHAAFTEVKLQRGYSTSDASGEATAALAPNPFEALSVPDGWAASRAEDPSVKTCWAAPAGVSGMVIDSEAAAVDAERAAALIVEGRSGLSSVSVSGTTLAGAPAAILEYEDGGLHHLQWVVVQGTRRRILALRGRDRSALDAARGALRRANPSVFDARDATEKAREEPTLF